MNKITTLFISLLFITTSFNIEAQEALNFDGANDAVVMNSSSLLNLTVGTLEAWIKTSNPGSSYRGIVVKQLAYSMFLNNNEFGTYDWSGGWRGTGQYINDDNWHHVAISFNSGIANNTTLYLDGNVVLTTTITISNQSEELAIGQGGDNSYPNQNFNGTIDEVRVWNVIKTQTEIQNSMNTELAGNETGLIAYFKFNQGTPNGDNSTETTLLDSGPNNINGTLNNFALTGTSSNWVNSNTLSIQENTITNQNIAIYPNPTKDFINIKGFSNSVNYNIYNILGKSILKGKATENEKISIENLSKGLYLINFDNGNSFKLIKE